MTAVPITTLSLDAGGVLVFPNWTRVSDALALQGVDVAPQVLAAADPRAKRRLDLATTMRGTSDHQRGWTYFNLVLTEAGIPLDDRTGAALDALHAYHAQHNLWETVPDDVRPALARLRGLGLRMIVTSNANGTLHAKLDRLALRAYFDTVIDSHLEGVEKPDPRIFEIALARSGATAASSLHVGDLYHVDVVGARRASMRPVLLDPHGLYSDADCARVASLDELADGLSTGRFD